MLAVTDLGRYTQHRRNADPNVLYELGLTLLLFGSAGAITWAIRGTSGWGGIDGTVVPGLTWGLLWYYLCYRKGIDARGIVLWLGLGLALGGELGYGQYVSWIQGRFELGDGTIPIAPWLGYLWFTICGIGWAAPGGIVLGWALGGPVSVGRWIERVVFMAVLIALIFNLGSALFGTGLVEWLGAFFVRWCPGLVFPKADLGIYQGDLDRHLGRTVYTNTQNFAVLLWWGAAMIAAAFRRDRMTLMAGAVIGGGFGPGFAISAAWCHGYAYAPAAVDWWKLWELHAGFNLGLLYAILLYLCFRERDKANEGEEGPHDRTPATTRPTWCLGIAGFVLIFAAGYEYFFWTGLALATGYFVAMGWLAWVDYRDFNSAGHRERTRIISLRYSIFLLVFLLFHGLSSRAVVVLGIHDDAAIDQYAWPAGRVALFAPVAFGLVAVTLWSIHGALKRASAPSAHASPLSPERMYDLMTFIGFVGAASIWPAKIGVLYAFFLGLAIFSLSRLNRCLEEGVHRE